MAAILDDVIMEQVENQDPQVFRGSWRYIPLDNIKEDKTIKTIHRLNSLGSLFYHSKVILRNHRLSEDLHLDICLTIEKENLKEVLEVPRDHFKSTICSESAPIWWGLPFTDRDELLMRSLGYSDEWIRWMRRAHNQDTRTLLVSENITNAAKLGVRIDGHYANNSFFKAVFPEIIPGTTQTWSQFTKTHKRSERSKPHGEGTYDYIGVGGALQSRHYDRVVQDDLVGKEAIESQPQMMKTIDYHKLLVGAFDSDRKQKLDNDEIVVGNRWAYNDLNSYIREEEKYFNIFSHSAIGGCCEKHPAGLPIFPEEFSLEKLARFEKRLGSYFFSCQFLNRPIPPKDAPFDAKYLRYYKIGKKKDEDGIAKTSIIHEVEDGEVLPDTLVNRLRISMIVDPKHSEEETRCNHAILVIGYQQGVLKDKTDERIYLLDVWAESANYDAFIAKIYEFADKYRLGRFWLETIAAQSYLKYHLEYRNRIDSRKLKVDELKTPRTKGAKDQRILACGPVFENRQFWCRRVVHEAFIKEYSLYPNYKTRDVLDVVGYAMQIWSQGTSIWDQKQYFDNYQPPMAQGQCGY